MTFVELQARLAADPCAKVTPYLPSFWNLTRDEQRRVRAKHGAIDRYMTLHDEMMRVGVQELSKAMSCPMPDGNVLAVESLEDTLSRVTFP